MRNSLITTIFSISTILLLSETSTAEGIKSREWMDLQWQHLEKATDLPLEDQLQLLRPTLGGIGSIPAEKRSSEEQQLYLRTQKLLTSTPGHALYYRDRILEAKNKAFKNGQPVKEPTVYHRYQVDRSYDIGTISHLSSVESVLVLTDFLDDKDQPAGKNEFGYYNHLAISVMSPLRTLLQDPAPLGTSWLDWRNEIRSGHRTFRFKGSDIRYNFDGPAPEKVQRQPKPLPSTEANGASNSDGSKSSDGISTSATLSSPFTIIAALLLLGAFAWWIYTKRAN